VNDMQKLNDVMARAKVMHRNLLPIVVDMGELRAIAEAFRALDRTADTNMAAAQAMRDDMYHWKQRAEAAEAALKVANEHAEKFEREMYLMMDKAEAAEAKLAELEKQPAVAWTSQANIDALASRSPKQLEFMTGDKSVYIEPVELFTRAAPAVNLAELVPDGWKLVPVEPTSEMLEEIWLDERFKEMAMKRRYYALLAAAPAPPE